MSDLRTKLRHHSDSFGDPGFALQDVQVLKTRRDQSRRVAATVVALGVAGLTSLSLWGAFVGSRPGNTGHGPTGAGNGRISFIVGELGGSMEGVQIAAVAPDGSGRQALIDGVPEYSSGGWSPDGKVIVFSRSPEASPDGHVHLWRMNDDGSGLEQLTAGNADDFDAQWSPDGSQILFRRTPDGSLQGTGGVEFFEAPAIFLMNPDGSAVRRVNVEPNQIVLGARWAPDGEGFLFIADTPADDGPEGFGIYTVRSDGTGLRLIVPRSNGDPQWSPDGKRILFQSGSRLVTVDGEGADLQTLVEGLHRDIHFRWSPDGERILYVRPVGPDQGNELWTVGADGSDDRRVSEHLQWPDPTAAWSPDGRLIAFTRGGDIWTVDVETGEEHQVTDTPIYESSPAWAAG